MKVSKAVDACLEYHQANSEKNTVVTYGFVFARFKTEFEKGQSTKSPQKRFSHSSLSLPRERNRAPSTHGVPFSGLSTITFFTAISYPSRTPVTAG